MRSDKNLKTEPLNVDRYFKQQIESTSENL